MPFQQKQCLWNAHLFPVCRTREDSFYATLTVVHASRESSSSSSSSPSSSSSSSPSSSSSSPPLSASSGALLSLWNQSPRLSMEACVVVKDSASHTQYRLEHHKRLTQTRTSSAARDSLRASTATAAATSSTIILSHARCILPSHRVLCRRHAEVRLPARVILAGGWSDTPPYTLEHGGAVVNLAFQLKRGTFPIKASARLIAEPVVRLTSVDQSNLSTDYATFETLLSYNCPGKDHSLLKAVVCLILFPDVVLAMEKRRSESPCSQHTVVPVPQTPSLEMLLQSICRGSGGRGIELITDCEVPKGTGLGTSSILMLACVRALLLLFKPIGANSNDDDDDTSNTSANTTTTNTGSSSSSSISISNSSSSSSSSGGGTSGVDDCDPTYGSGVVKLDDEFNAVMVVEQMLTTCGGWQDQVGGGVAGLKYVTTNAGLLPSYNITPIRFDQAHRTHFDDHFLVVFTGTQRLAKKVLDNWLSRWWLRDRHIIQTLHAMRAMSPLMFDQFTEYRDASTSSSSSSSSSSSPATLVLDRLGHTLERIKDLNIALTPSFTNEHIDLLFDAIRPFVSGSHLMGAGGGGYIVGFLKHGRSKEEVATAVKGFAANGTTVCFESSFCDALGEIRSTPL